MSTLYEFTAEIKALQAQMEASCDPETGEMNADAEALITTAMNLEKDRAAKILSIGHLIKHYEAMADMHKAELAYQKAMMERHEAKAKWLEDYLVAHTDPTEKFQDARVKIGYRKSKFVRPLVKMENLPAKYLRPKLAPADDLPDRERILRAHQGMMEKWGRSPFAFEVDKAALTEDAKAIPNFPFAEITENYHLQVK